MAVVEVVGESADQARREVSETIYKATEAVYLAALQEGLNMPRAGSFLGAARAAIDKGNFQAARNYLETVVDIVEKARAEVGETAGLVASALLLSIAIRRASRGARASRLP